MSASVVSLSAARERLGTRRWSNQDLAEIYRVADTLRRAGLPIDCDEGQTDEGDPWCAFCNVNTGDVIVHFAFIDGRYVAEVGHLGVSFRGDALSDIVGQFLNSYPVILPNNQNSATRVWMHPASGLLAFIATLYFLLEMSQSAEAREAASAMTVDGEAVDENAGFEPEFAGDLAAHINASRDPFSRMLRSDGTSPEMRAIAVSAAILIAGVLMDWQRTGNQTIAFEPESILDAILTKTGEELGDSIVQALKTMTGQEVAVEGGKAQSGDASAVRTAHLNQADNDVELLEGVQGQIEKLDGENALVIDLDGEFGETGRAIGAELHRESELGVEVGESSKSFARDTLKEERLADTIAASLPDGDDLVAVENGEDQGPGSGTLFEDEYLEDDVVGQPTDQGFLDAAPESSTVTLLQSLGLKAGTPGTGFEADIASLVQLISKPSDSEALLPTSPTLTETVVDTVVVEHEPLPTSVNVGPTPTTSSPPQQVGSPQIEFGADGGLVTQSQPTTPPATTTQPVVMEVAKVLGFSSGPAPADTGPENPVAAVEREIDFSIFDPVEVLQLFVQSIDKVGFAHLEEIFYLYDAVTIATAPEQLEFEQIHLENGDEVNLLGQAETFDAIYEALA